MSFDNSQYLSKIVNATFTQELKKKILDAKDFIIFGGNVVEDQRFVEPTVVLNSPLDSLLMKDEIFGPVLPIIEYEDIDTPIQWMISHPKALAAYYFGTNKKTFNRLKKETSTGALV